jgi:tripartite-type tricarboxylate transporter receptor subunit TctC
MKRIKHIATTVMAAGLLLGTAALADDYPSRAIDFIVPYKPGGGSDTILRPTAMHLEKQIGENIAIVNVAGAGGSIGWTQAAGAKPDG